MLKNKLHCLTIVALGLGLLLLGNSANAASRTWDYNSTGGTADGSGTWNTTSLNWYNGLADSTWNSAVGAWFGANAGPNPYTVSLGGGSISTTGLTFENQAYTISNGTLNLLGPTITVDSPSGGIISASITSTVGLTKAGYGTLTLTNTRNSFTGSTLVQGGVLVLGASNFLSPSASLVLGSSASNGTLDLAGFSQSVGTLGTNPLATAAGQTIGNSIASTTATLTINGSSTYGGSIQDGVNGGSGRTAVKVTGGLVILNGYNNYTGGTVISGGALDAMTTAALPGYSTSGNVSVAAGATLAVGAGGGGQWAAADIDTLRGVSGLFAANANLGIDTSGGDFAYPSNIANSDGGALGLVKLGSNALVLSGSNTYSGPTRINAGVLSLANSAALAGTSAVTFAGGTLQFSASNGVDYSGHIVNSTGPISIDANGQSVTFGSGLASSNTGGLTLNSTVPGGIVILAASNGYTGATRINAGVLSLANSAALAVTSAVTFAGGTLQYTASNGVDYSSRIVNSTGPILIDADGQSVTFGSGLAGSNTGGLTLNSTVPGGILVLAASNGYTGTTLVSGGTLLLASPNALSASSFDTSGTGSLSFGALTSGTFGGLQGSGNLTLSNTSPAAVALTVGGNNLGTTFSGQLSGGGSLTKVGSGLLFLSGSNNYAGSTAINGGMLQAATTAALPGYNSSGKVSVAANATLAVGAGGVGQWTTGNIDALRANGLFAANAIVGIDTSGGDFTYPSNIADSGAGALSLVKFGPNTLVLSGSNSYTGSTTIAAGILQLGSSTALYAGTAVGTLTANGTLDLSGNAVTVGTISGSGAVTDSIGTANLTFGNTGSSTFSGTLQAANLTKNGAGTFVLTGANNVSGTTAINQGTFQIGNGAANGAANIVIGNGLYNIASGAKLYLSQGTSQVTNLLWSSISGSGTLELGDALTSGAVAYTPLGLGMGTLGMGSGSLQVDNRGIVQTTPSGLGGITKVVINNNAQFLASDGGTSGASYTYPQNFSIAGNGNLVSGALRVYGMKANFSGSIALTANAGLYADNVPGTVLNVSGVISGGSASTLTIAEASYPSEVVILAAANTYSGNTSVGSGATVQLSNSAAVQNSTLSGGVFFDTAGAGTNSFLFGGLTGAKNLVLGDTSSNPIKPIALIVGNNNTSPSAYSGALSGSGSLTKIGSGMLTLSGTNTYVGATTISGGTLKIGSGSTAGALSPSSSILDNGTLAFSRNNTITQGIDFSSAGISGSGSLVQLTAGGNLVLNAANTYSGSTTVTAGTLTVNGSLAASSTVTVAAAGTLAGSGSVAPPTIVSSGGSVLGGYNNVGSLTLASLTFMGTSNLYGTLGSPTTGPAPIIVNGALTTAGSAITINIPSRPAVSGVYPFLQYGSLAGTGGTAAFKLPTPVRAVSLTSTGNTLAVNFDALAYPIWTGSNSTAFSGGMNWKLASNGTATDYQNLDAVVFDDTATSAAVNISGSNVTPYSTTFNNSLLNYTLTGLNGIAGIGSLTKNGSAGLLTIANSNNSYTGGTFINGGTLALGINNGLPSGGSLTIGSGASNGTFNLSGYNQSIGALAVGAGATPANQMITNTSGSSTLTYSPATAIASSYGGTIQDSSGGTLGLTVSSGTLNLTAANAAYHGATNVNSVLLVSALPNSSVVTVAGALDLVGAGTNFSTPIVNGGNIIFTGGSGTLSSAVLPPAAFISGKDGLTVASGGLTFASSNSNFQGNVTVSGGGTLNVPSGGYLYDFIAFGQGINFSVGNANGPGTLVVSGGTVVNYGGIGVTTPSATSANSSLIITGGVLSSGLDGVNGNGGIGIGGYCSVSGGLLTANGGTMGTCSINIAFGTIGGTANVSGGTVSADGNINIGYDQGLAVFNQLGGLVTCAGSLNLGFQDTPTTGLGGGMANLSGGTLNLALPGDSGFLYNGWGQSSTVNISGSATVIVPTFSMGYNAAPAFSGSAISNTLNLNGGTLQTNGIVTGGTGANTVNFNGGRLQATSGNPSFLSGMTNAYVLAGGAWIDDGGYAITIAQNLQSGASPDGGITKSGSGMLTLSGSNTYNGGTTVSGGTLQLYNSAALGAATGRLTVNSSTLDLYGYSPSVGALTGNSFGLITNSAGFNAGLTVSPSASTTFAGSIADGPTNSVSLSVAGMGAGRLVLTGSNNSYSGPTTLSGGVLTAGAPNALSLNSAVTVNGGTLDVTSSPQTIGSLAVESLGSLNLNTGNLLTISGMASFATGSTLNLSGAVSASLPELLLTYSGSATGAFSNISLNGGFLPTADQLSYSSGALEIVAAPVVTSSGNYSSSGGSSGPGQALVVSSTSASTVAVTLDVPVTLGTLQFGNSSSTAPGVAISGTNTLTLNNNGGMAILMVYSGTNSIDTTVSIPAGSLVVASSNDSSMTIAGNISGSSSTSLTLNGDGELILSGSNTYGGGTTVDAGTLIAASASALPDGSSLTAGQGASSIFAAALAGPAVTAVPAGVVAVPEPGTFVLLTAGAALLLIYRRRPRNG